jgi:hypothetical protein
MATRQIKMPRKDGSENEADEAPSQRQRVESGRYLLQVDRQTKGSYPTAESRSIGGAGNQEGLSGRTGVGV